MRDTTVTIHPTVKQSVNAVLYYLSVEEDKSIGKVIEEILTECPRFQEAKRRLSI